MERFGRYQLLTTDVEAGRAFYAGVLGAGFWALDVSVGPLPERLAALGVPANWRGYVGVADVEAAAGRMVALGGVQLRPLHPGDDGVLQAILRDPFGAPLGVRGAIAEAGPTAVGWHQHCGEDEGRTFALYAELFGWAATEAVDLGPAPGRQQMFSWDRSAVTVGGMANTARPPQVHPQWLFHFTVPDIDTAISKVQSAGGLALPPWRTATGDRAAACEDPQGAAFGLHQPQPTPAAPDAR